MTVTAPAPTRATASDADIRTRAVDALLACTARHGLSKTTLDDVAREAGCARASLYRHFGGKRPLVAAAVAVEGERIRTSLEAAAAEQETFEDALVAVVSGAADALCHHPALQFVLAHEAELVLPFVTFDAGDKFLSQSGRALAPCFDRFLPVEDTQRLGEWVVRITCAYAYARVFSPETPVDLADPASVRALVRQFVLPGFLPTPKTQKG